MNKKPILTLFIVGAIVGTLLDAFHVHAKIAYYTQPVLFQQPLWVPFLFGLATVLIGVTHAKINPMPGAHPYALKVTLAFFVLSYFVIVWSPLSSSGTGLLLFGFYLISWIIFDRSLSSLALALLTGLIGCGVESFLGYLAQYHYMHPDFFRIPSWLFPLYLNASAAGGFLGRKVFAEKGV